MKGYASHAVSNLKPTSHNRAEYMLTYTGLAGHIAEFHAKSEQQQSLQEIHRGRSAIGIHANFKPESWLEQVNAANFLKTRAGRAS